MSIKTSWSGVKISKGDPSWDKGTALSALDSWAGDDMTKYASAFLYKEDGGDPDLKGTYKFPIATVSDGNLVIIPAAVRNAAARASGADIPAADKDKLREVTTALLKRIDPDSDGDNDTDPSGDTDHDQGMSASAWTLTAGGGPLAPPRSVFEDPKFAGPTPMTVSPAGYVKGHIANWNVCHTAFTDACVMAPHSKTGYQKFHQGTALTAEGDSIRVGKITMSGGHAHPGKGMQAAVDHYDDSTTAAAVGRVGEDEHGIWFAGALVPGLTEEKVAELRRSPISGDWRWDQQVKNLELIAALAVNTPGFPIAASAATGEQLSLVAAGIVLGEQDIAAGGEETVVEDESVKTARMERIATIVAADQMRLKQRVARFVPFGER